ncbi:helix-turn-helix domain-containing protein [Flectobacillus major]|uniref:helix-turn-helix domain-containing protein n=1 Tax=Flectobacillus major TaxID=103 RepID=UPI00131EE12B|nr:helix-turn-helix domain-containing protein [Flectobacillus major]
MSKSIIATREAKGLKQSEVASRMNIDQPNYSRLEKRGKKLTLEQIEGIAKALEVSPNVLLGLEGESVAEKDDKEALLKQNEEYRKRIDELESRLSSIDEANRIKDELNAIKQEQAQEKTRNIQEKITEKMLERMYEIAEERSYIRLMNRRTFEENHEKLSAEDDGDYHKTERYFYYVSRTNDVALVTQDNFEKLLEEYYKDPWIKLILDLGLATEKEQAEWESWRAKHPPQDPKQIDNYLEMFSDIGATIASMVRNPFQTIGAFGSVVTLGLSKVIKS